MLSSWKGIGPALGLAIVAMLPTVAAASILERDDVQAFISEVSERHDKDRSGIERVLGTATIDPGIIEAITRPAEALPWHRYRGIFLGQERIDAGVTWWQDNESLITAAAERFGLDPAILVAVIGVETYYGRYRGRHRVVDALVTLAFDYPPRSGFFRRELEAFLLLVEEEGLDPVAVNGSYAGAMGMPQFISSSYRAYAVDGNGDGRRDLIDSTADAVASVGNYFSRHGWRPGEVIAVPATVSDRESAEALANQGRRPYTTIAELRAAGIRPESEESLSGMPDDAPATFMILDAGDREVYWIGLHNLFVITQYNHSALYALAVLQLAVSIAEARG